MKKNSTLSAMLMACLLVHSSGTYAQSCSPNFNYTIVSPDTSSLIVQFYDSSWYPDNTNNHVWNFGDGTYEYTDLNPQHTFPQYGNYNVCLVILDSAGNLCDSTCQYVPQFNPGPTCSSSFSYSKLNYSIYFSDYSNNAASWSWDFGDGSTSTLQNPVHTYSQEGYYNVCLTIADTGACTATYCTYVWVGCFQDTSFYYTANGPTVQFFQYLYDSTGSNMIFSWDFGDGNFSAQPSPVHTYFTFGSYNVCLSIQDTSGICADTFCKTISVNCIDASFYYNQNYLQKYTIDFTDNSSANIASWLWNFGDGTTDSVADPVHTYPTYGNYNVCLTVTSADSCTDQYCNNIYLQCCELDFAYSFSGAAVSFQTDSFSCGWFDSYAWYFGDGFSATQNYYDPGMEHVYLTPGIYTVCLSAGYDSVYYQSCRDSLCKNILVQVGDTCAGLTADLGCIGIRPQIPTDMVIHYCNFGNTLADNTTVTLSLDSEIFANSSTPPWSSQNGSTLTWNVGFLSAGQCNDIYVNVQGDATAQVGSVLCSDLLISSSVDDCDTADNSVQGCFNVVNSMDPNDKQIAAKNFSARGYVFNDTILPSDGLSYMIRFQNTGTAPAVNIFIYDTLDPGFDAATVLPGASSHGYNYFEIIGNVVKWSFLNINLADSTNNEPASHGFVKFSVAQMSGNQLGTWIPNRSGIVFDFNAPVMTNDALVRIDSLKTLVKEIPGTRTLSTFPNPVTDELEVVLPEKFHSVKCEISDVTGRIVYRREGKNLSGSDNRFTLSLAHLPAGVYSIMVAETGGSKVASVFVKQ